MNPLVKKFKEQKRWVNFRMVEVKGKITKIPYSPTTKGKASSTDPASWGTYEDAKKVSEKIGIVFTDTQDLLGIDIDHCLEGDKIVHPEKEKIEQLLSIADTYTEISPSGTGLHLFLSITEPFAPIHNKHAPFELYTKGRYFTVTENPFGPVRKIRTVTPDEAISILKTIGYPWEETVQNNKQMDLPSSDLLEKIFSSKNGQKIKALYNGDTKAYGDDDSSADLALCMHFAFWTRKDAEVMRSLWLSSPLGSRKKTQTRKDYQDRTINQAIKKTTDVYEVHPQKEESKKLDLLWQYNSRKEKVYFQNTENMCRVLKGHEKFSGKLRFDVFKNVFEIKDAKGWRGLEDADAIIIQTDVSILFPQFATVGKEMIFDALVKVSKENQIDSAADWVKSLVWDGTDRLSEWLSNVYGTPLTNYSRAVASNWLKGLVKRIVEPGCKFDYVLVLEGKQGSRKSTSLSVLGGDWHVETTMSTDSKDFFMQFQGKAIIEFSEGETLSKTEVKRMKAIITTQYDKYRLPYGRVSQDFPRRCVFAMTTNQDEYLKDETGNRRWLPVAVVFKEANVKWLENNRTQLFAEAYHRISFLKEIVYDFPEEETRKEQDERRVKDPNTDLIVDWYYGKLSAEQRMDGITTYQAYRDAVHGGFPSKAMNKADEMGIASVLKLTLLLERRRGMKNNVRMWRWYDPYPERASVEPTKEEEKILAGIGW